MKKILIVDDDESMRALLSAKLCKLEYEVVLAASGPEGVKILKKQKFDLISLDQIMPGMDGLETFRKMKTETKDLPPVIMVTGDKTLSVIIEFVRLGGSDYVVKSADVADDLILRMEYVWLERQKEKELGELRTVRKVAVTLMHEFNNALSIISGANALAKRAFGEISENQPAPENMESIQDYKKQNETISKNVERMRDDIKKLREMTEVDTGHYSEISEVFNLSGAGFQKEEI